MLRSFKHKKHCEMKISKKIFRVKKIAWNMVKILILVDLTTRDTKKKIYQNFIKIVVNLVKRFNEIQPQ